MAILYPNAEWRNLAGKSTTALNPLVIDVHTMVGTLAGTENYFDGSGNPYSHFGTGGNGLVWQWQELDYRAASDLDGNGYCISIENEDTGTHFPVWSGSDVPRFTDAQAAALVQLIAWLCTRFGIPADLIPDSVYGRNGAGYHRLGVDPYRVPSGVRWSSKYAKACPGDRRIAQLRDEIMPAVRVLLAGGTPLPKPQESLMPFPVIDVPNDPERNKFLALYPGGYEELDGAEYGAGVATGLLLEVKHVDAGTYDRAADLTKRLHPECVGTPGEPGPPGPPGELPATATAMIHFDQPD